MSKEIEDKIKKELEPALRKQIAADADNIGAEFASKYGLIPADILTDDRRAALVNAAVITQMDAKFAEVLKRVMRELNKEVKT